MARCRLQSDFSFSTRTALSVDEILHLLDFCLNATYLSLRGEIYKQTFGTAMGSPMSVVVANLVMEDVEERALATFDVKLPFWKHFVDDAVVAFLLVELMHKQH